MLNNSSMSDILNLSSNLMLVKLVLADSAGGRRLAWGWLGEAQLVQLSSGQAELSHLLATGPPAYPSSLQSPHKPAGSS